MKFLRKKKPPSPGRLDSRPKLELLPGGGDGEAQGTETEPSYGLIFSFLVCAATVLGALIYFTPQNRFRWNGLENNFLTLDQVYQQHGIERFLDQKAQLKDSIRNVLRESTDPNQVNLATNIAVYLFPDVLPDENFEKETAMDLWAESFAQIEKNPKSAEARVLFEDLRANIWNYELADRQDPKLSAPAREVIQIYDVLSSP